MRFFPTPSQFIALNTLSAAVNIFGRFAINVGIAFMIPFVSVMRISIPVERIFGMLSLMIPAIFVMICGTVAINVGREFAIP